MQIFLPIAGLPANLWLLLAVALAVGFLSTFLGISGAFLMAPLLIFFGISPSVAVATISGPIAASSVAGLIGHARRQTIAIAPIVVLLAGGLIGTMLGVRLFTSLHTAGQLDLAVSIVYLLLLAVINALVVTENIRLVRRGEHKNPEEPLPPGSPIWSDRLFHNLRLDGARIHIYGIPLVGMGLVAGFIGTVMGTGGGFVLVPALIYLLRMPRARVIATSMVFTVITMAFAMVMHAATNHLVDIILAVILIAGGLVGGAFGARSGQRLQADHLRLLLASTVLFLEISLVLNLISTPDDLYPVSSVDDE